MLKKEEIIVIKIKKIVEKESEFDFPEFLRLIRRLHGSNRRTVSQDTSIPEARLYYLETGQFKRGPNSEELIIISHYYGLPSECLIKKAQKFMGEGKNKPKGFKRLERLQLQKAAC